MKEGGQRSLITVIGSAKQTLGRTCGDKYESRTVIEKTV